MKVVLYIVSIVIALVSFGWLGLQIKPQPFQTYPQLSKGMQTIRLPEGLPLPVETYFREVYGEEVPVIESAVLSGRAVMRVAGIKFPARFRFTHIAGEGYRHYIEATLFGIPIMKVNERYLDGIGRMELPFGVFEGEQIDQAANLGLWSESIWLPAIFVTDPDVQWEAIDDETSILIVPFGQDVQRFTVRFDPETGLLHFMESMRYKDAEGGEKILWINEVMQWDAVNEFYLPTVGAATWFDEGSPWAVFTVEDVNYNVDVDDYIRATGK